jgi:adenosylmethionine-8-amino-7-oxononanoate aminotransferase
MTSISDPSVTLARALRPEFRRQYHRLISGQGLEVTDDHGHRLLDAVAGNSCLVLGYDVPEIVEAIAEQGGRLPYVHAMQFAADPPQRLAEELALATPPEIRSFFFCSGGSEAVESALKIARQYHLERGEPTRYRFIGRWQSFHGNTIATQSVGGHLARRRRHLPLLIEFPHIEAPNCYRCQEEDHTRCGERYAEMLRTAIERAGPETVAGFILETVTGATSAAICPPPGYLSRVREICDEYGILMISDEVFTAVGRTGRNFAFEHWGVVPDLVIMGKIIAAGFAPIGVVGLHDRVAEAFDNGSGVMEHNFTFASHPMVCAAATVAMRLVRERHLVERAATMGEVLMGELQALRDLPSIGDIRGRGLLIGVEFVQDAASKEPYEPSVGFARRVTAACYDLGLIVYPGTGTVDGIRGDHVVICPAFTLSDDNARTIARLLGEGVRRAAAEVSTGV